MRGSNVSTCSDGIAAARRSNAARASARMNGPSTIKPGGKARRVALISADRPIDQKLAVTPAPRRDQNALAQYLRSSASARVAGRVRRK